MRYLAMIFVSEGGPAFSGKERQELTNEYLQFDRDAKDAGVYLGGEALQSAETATVVRMLESGAFVTDGPFGESKETIAGFYVLECENLDQAIEWASKIPAARKGAIEVRPVMETKKD